MAELRPLRHPQRNVLDQHLHGVVAGVAEHGHEVLHKVQRVLPDDGQPPGRDVRRSPRRHEDAGQQVLKG